MNLRQRYFIYRWRFFLAMAAWALHTIKADTEPHIGWAAPRGRYRWQLNLVITLRDIESVRAMLRGAPWETPQDVTSSNEERPGSGNSSRATVGNPGIRQFTSRLDALKARVAAATTDESRWTDYDIFVRHAREDIERLVAVVTEARDKHDEECGCNGEACRIGEALAYWLAEEES